MHGLSVNLVPIAWTIAASPVHQDLDPNGWNFERWGWEGKQPCNFQHVERDADGALPGFDEISTFDPCLAGTGSSFVALDAEPDLYFARTLIGPSLYLQGVAIEWWISCHHYVLLGRGSLGFGP